MMKIVLLVGSLDEGKAMVRLAGLAMSDVVIPRSGQFVHGLTFAEDDLILQFPSWPEVPMAQRNEVEHHLRLALASSRVADVVPWVRLGRA